MSTNSSISILKKIMLFFYRDRQAGRQTDKNFYSEALVKLHDIRAQNDIESYTGSGA